MNTEELLKDKEIQATIVKLANVITSVSITMALELANDMNSMAKEMVSESKTVSSLMRDQALGKALGDIENSR